jgi:hypothetical protein
LSRSCSLLVVVTNGLLSTRRSVFWRVSLRLSESPSFLIVPSWSSSCFLSSSRLRFKCLYELTSK